ncbi:MAG: hypothetical protein FJX46_15365 [Alphaproteobacteria bacterium]|nr:hypothetical protein [Alphaproteobacteria bacterium]
MRKALPAVNAGRKLAAMDSELRQLADRALESLLAAFTTLTGGEAYWPLWLAWDPLSERIAAPLATLGLVLVLEMAWPAGWRPRHGLDWLIGQISAAAAWRLNRSLRSEATRRWRGGVLWLAAALAAGALGWILAGLPGRGDFLWLLPALALWSTFGLRQGFAQAVALGLALRRRGRQAAIDLAKVGGGRQGSLVDEHDVARHGVERLADGLVEAAVGPALWFLMAGLPGALVFVAVCGLHRRLAEGPHNRAFGTVVRRAHGVLAMPAALVAVPLLALSAPLVGRASTLGVWRGLASARRHPSHALGLSMAAMGGALGLVLGGPRRFQAGAPGGGWIGPADGRARAEARDLIPAAWLMATAMLWLLAAIALVGLAID